MALNARKEKSNGGHRQEPMEAATYPARVVQIIDLGMQNQRPYKNQPKPPAHEMMVTYEFVDEFCLDEEGVVLDDKPRWLSETFPFYNLDADKAKSTLRYRALDPTEKYEGDFSQLATTPCMVTVTNRQGTGDKADMVYNNIGGVAQMRSKDAAGCPELVNPPKVFLLDEPDLEILGSLPDWLQDKIRTNLEFEGSVLEAALAGKPEEKQEEDTTAPAAEPEETAASAAPAEEKGDKVKW